MDNFIEINNFRSMYLTNFYEPTANALFLEISESTTSEVGEDVIIGDKVLSNSHLVSIDNTGIKFNVSFQRYVAYQVMNESFLNFNNWDQYETGKYNT